jgi:hypothetical protein
MLVFDAQWRRVFGDAAGVDWDSAVDGEVDAWLSERSASVRCDIRRALAVLMQRATSEGVPAQGRSELLLLLRQAGAIGGKAAIPTPTPV